MAKKVNKTTKKAVTKKKTAAKNTTVKKAAKPKAAAQKSVRKKAAPKKTAAAATAKKTTPKSAGARKKSAAPKRRHRPKTNLTKKELDYFRELLMEKLTEIMGDVNHIELESLRKSRMDASGDLSSMPIHMADVGSDNYEQEFALGLMDSERKIVKEIHAALKRIEQGTYGICEGTQEPIPKPRLEGIPWTRYCIQYAEMLEKGLVVLDQDWYDGSEEEELDDDDRDDEDRDDDDDEDDVEDDEDDDEDDYEDDEDDELYFGFGDDDV